MRIIQMLSGFLELLEYKILVDSLNNQYVVYKESLIGPEIDFKIDDKTAFEALENHHHLLDHLSKKEFIAFSEMAPQIGTTILRALCQIYPQKHFVVSILLQLHGDMIVRFHQKWDDEPYYYVEQQSSKEKIFIFEN